MSKTLTLAIMDVPCESANTTTAFRIMAAALEKGMNVNVFAYEGAVALALKDQPLVAGLLALAREKGVVFDWVSCGPCADERGAGSATPGVRRGGPPDFLKMVEGAANTLVIPTR
jgi:tRNA 2-thiouridine synthesizing protein D